MKAQPFWLQAIPEGLGISQHLWGVPEGWDVGAAPSLQGWLRGFGVTPRHRGCLQAQEVWGCCEGFEDPGLWGEQPEGFGGQL